MLGDKLRQLRKEKSMTQQQLGKSLGISASTVGMYEQGRRQPDNETILKYCKLFDVTADYILNDDEQSKDITDVISQIKSSLLSRGGLMFNGKPLSEEDLKKIADTVELSIKVLALDKQ